MEELYKEIGEEQSIQDILAAMIHIGVMHKEELYGDVVDKEGTVHRMTDTIRENVAESLAKLEGADKGHVVIKGITGLGAMLASELVGNIVGEDLLDKHMLVAPLDSAAKYVNVLVKQ